MGSIEEPIRRWPTNASLDYIAARNELLDAEFKLSQEIERVAALRRSLPMGTPIEKEYQFEEASVDASSMGQKVTLEDLVGDRSLVIYHLMLGEGAEEACASCSMWIDGFNGVSQHIAQHADFVIVAKAPPDQLRAWAAKRGWKQLRVLSSNTSSFNADMNFEHPNWARDWDQAPGINVFQRDGNMIRHVYSATPDFTPGVVRGIDLYSPVWSILDLIPEGRGEWNPSNKYVKTE